MPIPLLSRKHGSLNHFPESPRESLENHRTEVVQESPRESLFKDRYFVSGCGIGSESGNAKRFKESALVTDINLFYEIGVWLTN